MAETKEGKTKSVKKIFVEPVHGPMHHIVEDYRISGLMEVSSIDPWLQAQIDTGKIRVVED